jgi:hypothetical protein
MKNINARLQEMTNKLSDKNLFESNGLGNEINFHVFDYDPEDEYIVREYLENYLLKRTKLNIKVFDIYDIIIDILKEKGFLEKCFEYEKKKGAKYLNDLISKTMGIGSGNDLIVKKIKSEVEPNQIIIITGIGKCYGIVRGHTILNNLHSVITNNPLIMFYPGYYDGQSFKLFNKLENDNYYRAFQLVSRK